MRAAAWLVGLVLGLVLGLPYVLKVASERGAVVGLAALGFLALIIGAFVDGEPVD